MFAFASNVTNGGLWHLWQQVMVFTFNACVFKNKTAEVKENADITCEYLFNIAAEDVFLFFSRFFLHPPQGEGNILAYELSEEAPFMFQLTPHSAQGLHQALAFLPKCCCDVTKVEFMKGYRLTNTSIEPLAFKVPRIKVNRADHLLHMPPPPFVTTSCMW